MQPLTTRSRKVIPRHRLAWPSSCEFLKRRPDGSKLDRWWADRLTSIFNHAWLKAMATGRLQQPFGRGTIKGLAGTFDFIGINYYTRNIVRFPPGKGHYRRNMGRRMRWSATAVTGRCIPTVLYRAIRQVLPYKKPIYITENGLPDREDRLRPAFILDHLRQIWHALSFCFPVMGYYHWSLVDNFEWERGWTQRFGLIAMDEKTQERTWRPSGRLYREICHSYSISSDMTARYAPHWWTLCFPARHPLIEHEPDECVSLKNATKKQEPKSVSHRSIFLRLLYP